MLKLFVKSSERLGLPPGTPIHTGKRLTDATAIAVMDYNEEILEERTVDTVEEVCRYRDTPTVTWINVNGIHDVEKIETICSRFDIHPLVLEDIVNTAQRPKMELYDNGLFLIAKMIYYNDNQELIVEQVSFVVQDRCLLSFQEQPGDIFETVRNRIRQKRGRIRRLGADYLIYSLIDAIVDHYFVLLEDLQEQIERFEEEISVDTKPVTLTRIHNIKKEMVYLRKSIWPLREIIMRLEREDTKVIGETVTLFFRDLYDHTVQVIEAIETFHEILSGVQDLYLSFVSNRMNEVMKALTVIATIFIPLTFIAGLYGMNFKYMPELEVPWAYPVLLAFMAAVGLAMVIFFRRKKWL
ncbi:MAG: magnesium/cobalt transporter CorA [Deltaproteobacteria bacterium]|nr:magnesium/cobalt transporter CorA [Deltaproteobacteria bacterium]